MPSKLKAACSSTALLAAVLLLCTSGAPVEEPHTESPAEEPSGEEVHEEPSDLLSTWKALADIARKEFEDKFQTSVTLLESYKSSSFPLKCPESNFSKEACFQRLAHGLLIYSVFLKHVENEYPNNSVVAAAKLYSPLLIQRIKEQMRHSERVVAPTRGEEEQLLQEFNKPEDSYHRLISAQSILHHLSKFLADGKRSIFKREKTHKNTQRIFHTVLNR